MKKVLVPTDYSSCAANAVRYAIEMAKRSGLSPVFCHIVPTMRNIAEVIRRDVPEYEDMLGEETEKLRKHILQQYSRLGLEAGRLNLVVKFSASFTTAFMKIMVEAKPRLVVMGTHGITNLRTRIFGTNTEHVVARSPVAVLSVPCNAKFEPFKSLVYFSDLTSFQEELKIVKKYAQLFKSRLAVIHFDYGWARTAEEEKLYKLLAAIPSFQNIRVSIDVSLLNHIRKHHRDKNSLVCLFHDKKGAIEKFLTGSNPEEATARLNRPVLSFQRD